MEPFDIVKSPNNTVTYAESHVIANSISEKVRIFCLITTAEKYNFERARAVKFTWAKRCTKYAFVSGKYDSLLPTIPVKVSDDYNRLGEKSRIALEYIYKKYGNNFDWFLKADDDTFVILENLRLLLLSHSPEEPISFGCKFFPPNGTLYHSGGAGYVLSRAALKKLVKEGFEEQESNCTRSTYLPEDMMIGICLNEVNVAAVDSRDSLGKHRFLPISPIYHFTRTLPEWLTSYSVYKIDKGIETCSDYAVAFHYVKPIEMYLYDYWLYHLRPFGIERHLIGNSSNIIELSKSLSYSQRGPEDKN
ncbi:unnamed protein product [Caenorhabditis bovis]|uniref:N-acetylgalactosaminide beta-1,3-galactosyltransferase n=1 Tax=Caenorhabditis bovis TaxID=2654633 RepID=A0A8S1EM50_9PELO|nr:unnamed protein product [Caenorhabditis bovis]